MSKSEGKSGSACSQPVSAPKSAVGEGEPSAPFQKHQCACGHEWHAPVWPDQVCPACNAPGEARQPGGAASPGPVAWRVKDFADGWILCHSEAAANAEAEGAGNLIEPLFRIAPADDRAATLSALRRVDFLLRRAPVLGDEWVIRDAISRLLAALSSQTRALQSEPPRDEDGPGQATPEHSTSDQGEQP